MDLAEHLKEKFDSERVSLDLRGQEFQLSTLVHCEGPRSVTIRNATVRMVGYGMLEFVDVPTVMLKNVTFIFKGTVCAPAGVVLSGCARSVLADCHFYSTSFISADDHFYLRCSARMRKSRYSLSGLSLMRCTARGGRGALCLNHLRCVRAFDVVLEDMTHAPIDCRDSGHCIWDKLTHACAEPSIFWGVHHLLVYASHLIGQHGRQVWECENVADFHVLNTRVDGAPQLCNAS